MIAVILNSKNIDSSCWFIQAFGRKYCRACQSNNTPECGANSGNARLIKQGLMKTKSRKAR